MQGPKSVRSAPHRSVGVVSLLMALAGCDAERLRELQGVHPQLAPRSSYPSQGPAVRPTGGEVRIGMTMQEVSTIIGRPNAAMTGTDLKTGQTFEAWRVDSRDNVIDRDSVCLIFIAGRLVSMGRPQGYGACFPPESFQ
jgi:hypothetical protein